MHALLKKLAGTDLRSIGKSNEIVAEVLADPNLFGVIFDGMLDADLVLRMRCADAIEKVTVEHPEYLRPYKKRLLEQIAKIDQQEVRWHVAQLFARLEWSPKERRVVVDILKNYLTDKSKIVKTFSMQALADIAEEGAKLRPQIIKLLERLMRTGSPAMKARGKKLLAKLKAK